MLRRIRLTASVAHHGRVVAALTTSWRTTTIRTMSLLRELGFLLHRITSAHKVPDLLPHPEGATTHALRGFTQLDAYSCSAVAGWCVVWSFDRRRSFERFFRICETSPHGTGIAPLIRALEAHRISVKQQRR
jgi:hypothetical protein